VRYIIDLIQNHANEIESLIKKGTYQSFAQFINTAVENQIHIEKSEIQRKVVPDRPNKKILKRNFIKQKNQLSEERAIDLKIPDTRPQTVSPPDYSQLACSARNVEEEKCWMWGQTNKILPVKIGLRALLNLINSTEWMDLEVFRNKAAEVAAIFAQRLISYEEEKNKKRDERISTGLPAGDEEFKSKARYKGHFLAYIRKDGKLDGALSFLRLVNLTKGDNGNALIGLTDAGLRFARLKNPVIDRDNFDISLGEEEIIFYLDHISKNVKGEFVAFNWLLEKLDGGIIHREEINKNLKEELGGVWEASDAVINTQRAGLMARMIEMGLIDRVRKGIRVFYYISDRGKAYLSEGINHA
jgi:Arc/MetJ-type ribon-helix-helix transcriptional regulator